MRPRVDSAVMLADYHPVDVLMLVGNVAPIALYFLFLGLVNSHARPFLTTSRSDFIVLTTVLVPILLWPVPALAGARMNWLLAIGVVLAAVVFWRLLPSRGAGYVIYNVSEAICLRLVGQALRGIGVSGCWDGREWRSDRGDWILEIRRLAVLRSVTLYSDPQSDSARIQNVRLGSELESRLRRVSQLPSTMGACLVVLGVCLLMIPMWMVGRHIQDLVDAMSHLFG